MTDIYRLLFETVKQHELHKYCDVNPAVYRDVTQTTPNSQIPDEDWYEVIGHATDNPWQQYNQLRTWEREDAQFVRNVRMQKMVNEPRWENWTPEGAEQTPAS
jgi:hypothetical protein